MYECYSGLMDPRLALGRDTGKDTGGRGTLLTVDRVIVRYRRFQP